MTVESLSARLVHADLPRSWGPSVHRNSVVITRVQADDGAEGTGFAWTPQIGPTAVLALVNDDIAPVVSGLSESPEVVWDHLFAHLHEGGQGLTSLALASVDLALWDLAGKRAGMSLASLLGQRRDAVATYGSGVNLHYDLDELVEQVQRFVDAGHHAVKIKVGSPDIRADVRRVAAVREVLGPDRSLMIDANQRWDLPTARRAMRALEPYGLDWIEEPLRANDLRAHRDLRSCIDTPIAVGENLHTVYRFAEFMDAGAVDIVQPNITRVGGITPLRRIVALAQAHSLAVAPHLLPELSAQIGVTLPSPVLVEDIDRASFHALGLLRGTGPVEFGPGWARPRGHIGLGFDFA